MNADAQGPDASAWGREPGRRAGSLKVALRIALHALGLALLIRVFLNNRASFVEVFDHGADPTFLALAFGLCLSGLITTFIRWLIVVRAQGLTLRVRDALRIGFAGNAVDLVIPGQIGGDVLKANFLCRTQEWKVRAVASIFVDRALGILGLFTLAAGMGMLNWPTAPHQVRRLILVVCLVWAIAATGFAAVLTPPLFRLLERIFAGRRRLGALLGELRAMSMAYADRKLAVGLGLVMSTASHSLYAISFHAVGLSLLAGNAGLKDTMLMVPLVLFTTIIPLPFGALGLSEQVSDDLFGLIGHANGALAMLGFRAVSLAVSCISIAVYAWDSREVAELRPRQEQARSAEGVSQGLQERQRLQEPTPTVVEADNHRAPCDGE